MSRKIKNLLKNNKILSVLLGVILFIVGCMVWKYTMYFAMGKVQPIIYFLDKKYEAYADDEANTSRDDEFFLAQDDKGAVWVIKAT